MIDLRKLPEFKALQDVLAALIPLKPEGRRKVIEAVHSLIEISAGRNPSHGMDGPGAGAPRSRRRKRRR